MTPVRYALAALAILAVAGGIGAVAIATSRDAREQPSEAAPVARGDDVRSDEGGVSAGAAEPAYLPVVSAESPAPAPPAEAPERGVTVTGTAVVEARPDRSEWSFGVQEQGETARQALDRASDAAARLVETLRRGGIADDHVRTEQVSVWPNHDGRGISGYVASTSVRAEIPLERASRVLDAAVSAGANQVSGPGLSSGDRDRLYRQALAAALDHARANARALAARAGAELGPAVAIRESGSVAPPVYEAAVAADAAEGRAMPIQPGRQQISAMVTVTFALGPPAP